MSARVPQIGGSCIWSAPSLLVWWGRGRDQGDLPRMTLGRVFAPPVHLQLRGVGPPPVSHFDVVERYEFPVVESIGRELPARFPTDGCQTPDAQNHIMGRGSCAVGDMRRATVYPIELKVLCHGTRVVPPGSPGQYLDRPQLRAWTPTFLNWLGEFFRSPVGRLVGKEPPRPDSCVTGSTERCTTVFLAFSGEGTPCCGLRSAREWTHGSRG